MTKYEEAREDVLLFFLTEYSDASPVAYVETVAKDFLKRTYAVEWAEQFWENLGEEIISDLLEEYNRRVTEGFPVHFTFEDDEGRTIRGWANPDVPFDTAGFQGALLALTDSEFEKLSARILDIAGSSYAWATPFSHDQGLDAFGCFPVFKGLPRTPGDPRSDFLVWILVQAKHYSKERIRSSEIREFVGSTHLAQFQIYAQKGHKYEMLDLRALTPRALVLVTSGEVKRTARLLADQAGIVILTSSDLCAIFSTHWTDVGAGIPDSLEGLAASLRQEAERVPIAR